MIGIMTKKIEILDATVRDGSYAQQDYFSLGNVVRLSHNLSQAGIKKIEVCHGFGLGAARTMSPMPCQDEEYIATLARELPDVSFGAFAFPRIAEKSDIRRAAATGLAFLRVGFFGADSPFPLTEALNMIEYAKTLDLWVCANVVRTQFMSPTALSKLAKQVASIGGDCIYVVDSTGGSLPNDIKRQVCTVLDACGLPVGFHGHDNFRMAVANSLAAADAGATILDGTLRGIGRDSGNAQVEVLAATLIKAGFQIDVDLDKLIDAGTTSIGDLFPDLGIKGDNLYLAVHDLMTHGLPLIRAIAKEFCLDWKVLATAFKNCGSTFESEQILRSLARNLCGVASALGQVSESELPTNSQLSEIFIK